MERSFFSRRERSVILRRGLVVLALLAAFSLAVGAAIEPSRAELPKSEQAMIEELLKAAGENDTEKLSAALWAGVPVDARDARGRTALLIASHANAVEAAKILIQAGADVNAKDDIEDSPYLYAGAEGKLEILKMTVAAGADLAAIIYLT
jgi:ankyrin repeat protein